MLRLLAIVVIGMIGLLAWSYSEAPMLAQRPPEVNEQGEAYLRVNINPTRVPPMVNINPDGYTPRVEVTRMPEILIPPLGCDSSRNFDTKVGRSVSGPIRLSFVNLPQAALVTFVENAGRTHRVMLNVTLPLGSAIYLGAGQRLDFDSDVMYSGCRPER